MQRLATGFAKARVHDPHQPVTDREPLYGEIAYERQKGYKAAKKLQGLRYGEFDGPSMGMYSGHIDQSEWMQQFGVHVHHVCQLSLAWRLEKVSDERVEV